jgi:hypothetical protein
MFNRSLSVGAILFLSSFLLACGGGGGSGGGSGGIPPVAWTVKTASHGVTNLVTTHLLTVGTDLYLVGSQQVGNNYAPVLYKSTNSGATWTAGTAPSFTSLIHFVATSDGSNLYLAGGRTSDATVTATASYSYNNDVLKFTPALGTWTTVASAAFNNASGGSIGGAELSAMAYDSSAAGTMYVSSGERKGVSLPGIHKSTNYGVSWNILTNAPKQAGHCLAVSSAGQLHSLGGYGLGQSLTASNLSSDFVSTDGGNSWTEKSSTALASPYQMGCGFVGSTLYAVGGTTQGATTAVGSVRRSSDGGTTWTTDAASTTFATRARAGLAVLAGKLLVFGGSSNGTNTLADVIEGTP